MLLSALLGVELKCPIECLNGTDDRNFSSLNQDETCPTVLGAFLAVGTPSPVRYSIESYIPSPCLQKLQCSNFWCSVFVNLDLLSIFSDISGNKEPAPVSLLLNLSAKSEVRTVLSTRSTVQYALSDSDAGVTVSGAVAPDMIDGDNSIFFRLFLLNPRFAQPSAAHVTIVGVSGVIEGIGVSILNYGFFSTIASAFESFTLQVCSDVIAEGCTEMGKPNALTTLLSGSVMSSGAERPFFQAIFFSLKAKFHVNQRVEYSGFEMY